MDATRVDYFQDEANHWQFTRKELDHRLQKATEQGVQVKALVVVSGGLCVCVCVLIFNWQGIMLAAVVNKKKNEIIR
jgi:hypothetical protein